MATALPSFRLASVRASSSSASSSRRSDPNHRKPASVNWWAPLFGWSSDPDYVASTAHSSPNLHGSSESELEAGRTGPRFPPGCFTEEKAKQLRKKTMESSTFHDIMYHSAIASRLASDASESSLMRLSLYPSSFHSMNPSKASGLHSLVWFRKGLRIHDNPALEHAAKDSQFVYPLFVIDPHFMEPDSTAFSPGSSRAGLNRIRFLLEGLVDLDTSFKKLGSRLLVLQGDPGEVVISCLKEWNVKRLCFEYDTEPYYQGLDDKVKKYASSAGIEVFSSVSHTLFNPADIIKKNGGKPPLSYQSFLKLAGQPSSVSSLISTGLSSSLPPIGDLGSLAVTEVPTIKDLGYDDIDQDECTPFRGGESEALRRLSESMSNKDWVAKFEKPKGDPSAFMKPATTVLSPYLKFGFLSSRYFYQCLQDVYKNAKSHSSPPVSLVGQLFWREFFYTAAFGTPNFDHMRNNRICKQIPWNNDEELLAAWKEARTGYPWIDAIMVQLRKWGWMHHLARHCVACFLTRGDLFVHWEKGRDVFGRLLIDSDWAINNGNWLWLSCSSFFYQYNRIYSPITFGKKYDPSGKFIRHFLPVLKDMPKEYIYEPWTAPLSIQTKAKCIIGKDYPKPVVLHDIASKDCRRKMGESYALNQKLNGLVGEEDLNNLRQKLEEDQNDIGETRGKKQKLLDRA